jgi:DNA-binding MarR family transcriptional regulator
MGVEAGESHIARNCRLTKNYFPRSRLNEILLEIHRLGMPPSSSLPGKTENPSSAPSTPLAQIVEGLPHLLGRMHRRFLDVVRIELTRQGITDISPVQAMMLGNIGQEEISVHDLIERGYYLGSNASYNLKQLVDGGYIERHASPRDRREARLTLSEKGKKVFASMNAITAQMAAPLTNDPGGFDAVWRILRKLEQRWSEAALARE